MAFSKTLSKSEAKYKYIGLPKKTREEDFPKKDEIFDVKFKGKVYKMKVNNKDCIMLSQLYDVYEFKEDDVLTIDTSKKIFEMSVG